MIRKRDPKDKEKGEERRGKKRKKGTIGTERQKSWSSICKK